MDITLKQINLMKHAIGISEDKIKRKKYEAYRNYYTTTEPNKEWIDLVQKDLAISREFDLGVGENPRVYHVTLQGLKLLGEIMSIKITEMD